MHTYNQFKNSELMVAGVGDMVRTIEKIAASRLHRMNEEVARLTSYATELERVLSYLSKSAEGTGHPLTIPKTDGDRVLVIVGSNKGLVGGLHNTLIALFQEHTDEYQRVVAVGRRVRQLLEEERVVPDSYFEASDEDVEADKVTAVSDFLFTSFTMGGWREVDVLYPKYLTLSLQEPVIERYLPFTFQPDTKMAGAFTSPLESPLPVFEPSRARVYDRFLDLYIRVRFYRLVLDAKLSELSARTIEMEHAATKADGMLAKIRHDFARERRANNTLKQLSSYQVSQML